MKCETFKKMELPYLIVVIYSFTLLILAPIINTPEEIILGLKNILLKSDILITDYFELGGIGATFINSSLILLFYITKLKILKIKPSGAIMAGLFTVAGFSLFGKNLINIIPIILGIWIYSKFQKEPYKNYIIISLFGTTLAPTVTLLSSFNLVPIPLSIILAISISLLVGFILPPLASHSMKLHQGYNLYNIGLAAGLIGTMLMSILRAFGIDTENRLLWYKGDNILFFTIFFILFMSMIIIGYIINGKKFNGLKKLYNCSGRLICDFTLLFGEGVTLINMGILGLFALIFVVIIGGDINGPTLGGILTICGFGAFGKHLKNVIPIMIGATMCSILNIWPLTSPLMILSILFSTTLSPISGTFGPIIGIIAGFLHVCMVMNIGYLHGGLILYNNGFSGGIVAMTLVPIVTSIRKGKHNEK